MLCPLLQDGDLGFEYRLQIRIDFASVQCHIYSEVMRVVRKLMDVEVLLACFNDIGVWVHESI